MAEAPWRDLFGIPAFVHVLLFSVVLLSAVYASGARGRVLRVTIALAIPAVALEWVSFYSEARWLTVTSSLFTAAFLLYATVGVVRNIVRPRTVSLDTILGGVVAYLMIGIFFLVLFSLVEFLQPGSFTGATAPMEGPDLLYFSFVTLTTLGYGDIQPVAESARTLAFFEALAGQLYLTVMIAWLVGTYISQRRES